MTPCMDLYGFNICNKDENVVMNNIGKKCAAFTQFFGHPFHKFPYVFVSDITCKEERIEVLVGRHQYMLIVKNPMIPIKFSNIL